MSPPAARNPRSSSAKPSASLNRLSDAQLLDLRFCDLKLAIGGSLAQRIDRLYQDLADKGLARFRPHCWLSSEWFSPDGVPGIAIPFYLAHPRLTKLEKSQMLSVEGGSEKACLRILRHEAGHCIDTAYRLHRRKRWRELFGSFATPYPDTYKPRPNSRKFVTHLDGWYAQAHPAEDFAETFAVWLQPRSRWRSHYRGWPALQKLEYVDELMAELAASSAPPPVRSRKQLESITQDKRTLREHYREKKLQYADAFPEFYDADLRKIFSDDRRFAHRPTAASFLRKVRPELRDNVARWTGTHAYTIDQVLRDMIDRCKELGLRLAVAETKAKSEATMMVTVQTMNYMLSGHHPVAL
ncbi:MAG: putative zinc-binding metallopeptidase [Planctomycetota bacterium]